MINTDALINGYKVLYEKLDETLNCLTIRQLKELEVKLEEAWDIVKPRGKDRRK